MDDKALIEGEVLSQILSANQLKEVLESKRVQKHIKDLQTIISTKGTVDKRELEEINETYKWQYLLNELDILLEPDMTNHNFMRDLKQDLVFERVLGHPTIMHS